MHQTPQSAGFGAVDTAFGLSFVLVLILLPLVWIAPPVQWHDQQRIGQVLLGLLALILFFRNGDFLPKPSTPSSYALVAIMGLGVLSSMRAHQVQWAFAEMAVFAVCLAIVMAIAGMRRAGGHRVDQVLAFTFLFVAVALLAKFLVAYAAALMVENIGFFPWDMVSGFSNVRFQGHFVSLAVSLALLPAVLKNTRPLIKVGAIFLAAGLWMTVFAVGTRGTWLGLGVAAASLFWVGGGLRRLSWLIVASGAIGWLLMLLLFDSVPHWVFGESRLATTEKALATLSDRDIIWSMALDMVVDRPLLGFGPMHFADVYNTVAAHPHQAVLQWAAEWGVPSAILVSWVFLRAFRTTASVLVDRKASALAVDRLRGCLAASALALLVQAMVDGVLVMPYSQLVLSVVLGWLWALHPVEASSFGRVSKVNIYPFLAGFLVAIAWLVHIVLRDYPMISDPNFMFNDIRDAGFPRFWLYGMIYKGS